MPTKIRPIMSSKPSQGKLDLLFDARGLAGQVTQVVELGAAHAAAALDFDTSLIEGLCVWNTRSTPSPCEILRTVNEELRPRLLLAMTTPS